MKQKRLSLNELEGLLNKSGVYPTIDEIYEWFEWFLGTTNEPREKEEFEETLQEALHYWKVEKPLKGHKT